MAAQIEVLLTIGLIDTYLVNAPGKELRASQGWFLHDSSLQVFS